ncbi:MAG: SDR family NAD(P)-dependent oxidoreductase, partial [Pseudoxanthomonas sp.]
MTQRIAVVTGGLGGLGLAICQALANAGRKVIAADLPASPERLDEFRARTASLDIETAVVDVADFDACAAFVHEVETRHGPPDILVNNAGLPRDATLRKMDKAQWDEVIGVN